MNLMCDLPNGESMHVCNGGRERNCTRNAHTGNHGCCYCKLVWPFGTMAPKRIAS